MKQNHNSRRVNERAREALANILLFDVSDPALHLVTVTGCEVSVDESFMRAFIACEADRYDEVLEALTRARGHIRTQLARQLDWRQVPELDFRIDTTTDEAERIGRALENVPSTMSVEKDENGYPVPAPGADESDAALAAGEAAGEAQAEDPSPVAVCDPGDVEVQTSPNLDVTEDDLQKKFADKDDAMGHRSDL